MRLSIGSRGRRKARGRLGLVALAALVAVVAAPAHMAAQENADCLLCHDDPEAVGERGGREISVYVDPAAFAASVHADFACVDCHDDLAGVELPHDETVEAVDCATCHDDVGAELAAGPHGGWAEEPGSPAAACVHCHGAHDVLAPDADAARTARSRVGALCGQCHRDEATIVGESVHDSDEGGVRAASCKDCHRGHDMTKPRTEDVEIEVCGRCHAAEVADQARSVHARAALKGDPLAPSCVTCHRHHAVASHLDPSSPTSTMNIPLLCGRCHHEGSKVSLERDIPQKRILENYSLSIHGEGLFKMGLTVTAVCTSCHRPHLILEPADPASSINPRNVAETCTRCHSRIEDVHLKVIEGRLWESEPHKIPVCIDCHQPHKIRRTPVSPERVANKECMRCHGDRELSMERDGEEVSLYVDGAAYESSSHAGTACAQCHTEVDPTRRDRACAAIRSPVDCGICHAEQVEEYSTSIHGTLAAEGDPEAPVCLDCHSKHATQDPDLPTSPTFSRNVPQLCARCHRSGEAAARRLGDAGRDIVSSYEMSIHGKGLVESGLVVSATCTDCHTAHHELPPEDPLSSVNDANIAATCGSCHNGIFETFKTSIHWPGNVETDAELPSCEDCHTSHTISRTDVRGFRLMMMNQCGKCHQHEAETFFDTYHGKVSRLGSEGAAKCYDCHGTHNILPPDDPNSTLSHKNVVATCATCHAGAHRQFAGYLTHATHHNPQKYPFLFYSFWFMTALLVGTMSFALLHTLAWLWRLLRTREQWIRHRRAPRERLYVRFSRTQRLMHLVMILSFFTLALTGMTLKFSYMGWAVALSHLLGGFSTMGVLHRVAAVTLLGLFAFHLRQAWAMRKASGKGWLGFVFGPDSMMFNLTDLRQIWQSIKWFFGRGPRPRYGRFTYWEKFDYFAVFWGVVVIGSTGLVLWFPELFTRFLPGWSVNVATIIHSDEALLAVAFIFTIHFFNTHFRPDKFPMDPVIFTGRVSLEELRHDKPVEYEALVASGSLDEVEARLVDAYPRRVERLIKAFGFTALGIGLTLVVLIVYAMLFGYR